MITKMKTNKIKINKVKSRKELRKEQRILKKQKKNEYYTNRNKPGKYVKISDKTTDEEESGNKSIKTKDPKDGKLMKLTKKEPKRQINSNFDDIQNEKRKTKKLQDEMRKQRKRQLLDANTEEEINIKKLEKHLKLNKRKSKAIPKSFIDEGLDYLLEMCDGNMKGLVDTEQELHDVNNDFEEDFALMTGKSLEGRKGKREEDEFTTDEDSNDSADKSNDGLDDLLQGSGEEDEYEEEEPFGDEESFNDEESVDDEESSDEKESFDDEESSDENTAKDSDNQNNKKRKKCVKFDLKENQTKKIKSSEHKIDEECNEIEEDDEKVIDKEEVWEDIYGRIRTKDGAVVTGKYVPPALRNNPNEFEDSEERKEKLLRLKRQLKGLLNRLAEANMHSISNQIEELYSNNSRNDMNETITTLMLESLASHVTTPERLLLEHAALVSILHANIGTEVGAYFLQTVVKKFDEVFNGFQEVEDKTLDNVVHLIAQLYNFKLFQANLLYDILKVLSGKFDEKSVECILLVLKNVGFSLRRDDPILLKNLIIDLQKRANGATEDIKDNLRVKFMLDILLAIKNNNVSKIPNYDTTYSEHLKKVTKQFVRKGNYVTQLNISLEDLLKADTKGKWWIVGSAWTGNIEGNATNDKETRRSHSFSQKLLDLARKQRMNTDTRRDIFCIIMSAEDYLDAFEKLLRLGLRNQQEREIINVILHCCLQEKKFNPYYAVLAQKFCDCDRKYQMMIKFSTWDKLKALTDCSATQLSNLAKLLTHLFLEKGLPISTLKIVHFSELDKITLRFMRQVLLGVLLCDDAKTCLGVFEKVSHSDKLKMFRESLRLFLHHFLLKNLDADVVEEEQRNLLKQRVEMVEKILLREKSVY